MIAENADVSHSEVSRQTMYWGFKPFAGCPRRCYDCACRGSSQQRRERRETAAVNRVTGNLQTSYVSDFTTPGAMHLWATGAMHLCGADVAFSGLRQGD